MGQRGLKVVNGRAKQPMKPCSLFKSQCLKKGERQTSGVLSVLQNFHRGRLLAIVASNTAVEAIQQNEWCTLRSISPGFHSGPPSDSKPHLLVVL